MKMGIFNYVGLIIVVIMMIPNIVYALRHKRDENNFVWHNGATSSYNSYIAFNDKRTIGIVILANLNSNDHIPATVIGAKMMKELL